MAVSPVPMPTTMPHSRMSCHTCVIASDASMPAEIRITAETITARTPNRFMKAAANGPNNPNSMRRSASADEICSVSQPNSFSSGTISTPGVLIAAAVTMVVRKVTATMTQP